MKKIGEIKFRDLCGDLVGRQNGMMFIIRTEPGPSACIPTHWVTVSRGSEKPAFSTIGHQYFCLDEAKEFCQRIAAGEIALEDLRAAYDAEDAEKEQAAVRETTEKAKKLQTRLDSMGLKYTDLLELEVLAHSLGETGHQLLLAWERKTEMGEAG